MRPRPRGAAEAALNRAGVARRARGYAILVSAMVASAFATTYLTAHVPDDLRLLSQLIGQVSTLGVYVLGAPIWEPLSSAVRKFAFGIEEGGVTGSDRMHLPQWHRTQLHYGLNAQMGRNIAPSFLSAILQMFYEARRAMQSRDVAYAIDQVAAAAVALRRHYADLSPDDPAVTAAVRASFTDHVEFGPDERARVQLRIEAIDSEARDAAVASRYRAVLDAWLPR